MKLYVKNYKDRIKSLDVHRVRVNGNKRSQHSHYLLLDDVILGKWMKIHTPLDVTLDLSDLFCIDCRTPKTAFSITIDHVS